MRKILSLIILGLFSMNFATSQNLEKVKETRQAMFKVIGWEMGVLSGMAKGEVPFDQLKAQQAGITMNAISRSLHAVFVPGSYVGSKTALSISNKQGQFNHQLEAFVNASSKMITVDNQDALRADIGQLGATCKNCHTAFRVD